MQQKKVVTISFATIFALLLLAPILTRTVSTLDDDANSLNVSVSLSQTRIQEGENTTITIDVRQATPGKTYTLGINVTNPAGAFSALNTSITTNEAGSGSSSNNYWGAFTEANTDYVGTYVVAVKNVTTDETLVTPSFTVGLTKKLKYARNETVNIRGSGYGPNKNVTVNIKLNDKLIDEHQNVPADGRGIVNGTWQIPVSATSGLYTVNITNATSPSTVKNPPDVQDFYVEVWQVQISARNLADEPVAALTIKVHNDTKVPTQFFNLTQTTNEIGWSSFMLATGNYTLRAFWKQVEVGNLPRLNISNDTVSEEKGWVQLSNLEITTIEEATGKTLPFITLKLEYNHTIETTETNLTGTALIHNLFTNVNYTVRAERYEHSLPSFQTKIAPLPLNELTVKFPTYTMSVHVEDSKQNPAEAVTVEAYEWGSGLTQSKTTDSDGNVIFSLTFGRYKVRVLDVTLLLNETIIDLIQNQSSFNVYLPVYNIDFTVSVVDYLKQPISNAMVKIERRTGTEYEVTTPSRFTGPDGHVTFSGVLGGDLRISVYIGGELSETRDLYLTDSEQVKFSLSRYVVIAGYVVETSQFLTAIAIAILIVAFILALTYKRLYKIFTKSK